MAAPITIKKRKVAVKPKPAMSIPTDDSPDTPVDTGDADGAEAAVFVSQPRPTGGSGGASSRAMSVAAVLALIATLIFLFLLLLQWTEYNELDPMFPGPVPIGLLMACLPW